MLSHQLALGRAPKNQNRKSIERKISEEQVGFTAGRSRLDQK